jgi:CHC2 zinc finger
MNDLNDLAEKIAQAKRRLPLPELMAREGLSDCAKKAAHCPFHDDEHKSFSVFHGADGKGWQWKCHTGCGSGDEIAFVEQHFGITRREAIKRYLDMAGFSPRLCHTSHEYPQSPQSHERPKSHKSPVYPMSNGQGLNRETEKVLKTLAAGNACTEPNTARKRRFKLLRGLKAIEKGIGRELEIADLMVACKEWYRLSQPFLDTAKSQDDYLAAFLAELGKVRVPTGEGNTLNKALEAVARFRLMSCR